MLISDDADWGLQGAAATLDVAGSADHRNAFQQQVALLPGMQAHPFDGGVEEAQLFPVGLRIAQLACGEPVGPRQEPVHALNALCVPRLHHVHPHQAALRTVAVDFQACMQISHSAACGSVAFSPSLGFSTVHANSDAQPVCRAAEYGTR